MSSKKVTKTRVSQSLMKSIIEYENDDLCGLVFEEKFVNGNWDLFPPSDVQRVGTWFEYMVTNVLPKDGLVPEPVRTRKGELTAPYKKMQRHISNYNNMMEYYGIEVVEAGVKYKVGAIEGTWDLRLKATEPIVNNFGEVIVEKDQEFIGDIKTTGLLDDKWNPYGWDLDSLSEKTRLILQPIHYKLIAKLKFGKDYPFIFLLFNTKDEADFRMIEFRVDDARLEQHKKDVVKYTNKYVRYLEKGFEPKPTVTRCASCPLRFNCEHFKVMPDIVTHYQVD